MAPKPKRGLDKRQKAWVAAVVGMAAILLLIISLSPPIKKTLFGEASWGKVKVDVGKIQGTKIKGSIYDTKKITATASTSLAGCTGTTPGYAQLCPNDDTGFTGSQPKALVESCTASTKCEFVCLSGYVKSGDACVESYECTGTKPEHSYLCVGDDIDLVADAPYTVLESLFCTSNKKCEIVCAEGYEKSGNDCVESNCGGFTPGNSWRCSTSEQSAQVSGEGGEGQWQKSVGDECGGFTSCEYACNEGYKVYPLGDVWYIFCLPELQDPLPNNVRPNAQCYREFKSIGQDKYFIENYFYPTPPNSKLCSGDDKNLAWHTPIKTVNSCTNPKKCEYVCDLGYYANGDVCVAQ